MSLIKTDSSLGLEVEGANVKIAYYTVNRSGFFADGTPKLSANLYLEYSKNGNAYYRKDVTIENVSESETDFRSLYGKLKETEEFSEASDFVPKYEPIRIESEETVETTEETIIDSITEESQESAQ